MSSTFSLRSSAVVSALILIKAENAMFSLTVSVDVIKSCYIEIECIAICSYLLFTIINNLLHAHFASSYYFIVLHTWTTYPDSNLKFGCSLWPSTSTSPVPSFLPDSMSNRLLIVMQSIHYKHYNVCITMILYVCSL